MGTERSSRIKINKYWIFVGIIIVFFLGIYILAEVLKVPYLTDVSTLVDPSILTALISIGLLTIDAILPIPASLVMVVNGSLYGVVIGTVVSLIGSLLGFLVGYWLGDKSSPLINKIASVKDLESGNHILRKYGMLAIILTRSLPILGETTAIMAGVSKMSFVKSITAASIGLIPVSAIYAFAGSQTRDFNVAAIIFVILFLLAVVVWLIDRRLTK